jgi:NTP pyrophosphatase (non-canonical NTP hydrolase)
MSIYDIIQIEHRQWQEYNFGKIPVHDSILGAMEELGELCHAYTKLKQGNRVNEDHVADMKDAIGDIVIFLISICNERGWNFQDIVIDVWTQVRQRDWRKYPENGIDK